MSTILINPLDEMALSRQQAALRLQSLRDKTIALLDISKPGGQVFLDRLEKLLTERHGVGVIQRYRKPTYTKLAPAEMIEKLKRSQAVIEALAD